MLYPLSYEGKAAEDTRERAAPTGSTARLTDINVFIKPLISRTSVA